MNVAEFVSNSIQIGNAKEQVFLLMIELTSNFSCRIHNLVMPNLALPVWGTCIYSTYKDMCLHASEVSDA